MLRLLFRSGISGLAIRIFVVCSLLGLVLVLLIGLRYAECLPSQLTEKDIKIAFFVVAFSTASAQFFSEYPPGEEKAFLRVAIATMLRTGLPAMVIVVGGLFYRPLITNEMVGTLMLFYGIGLITSLYLEIGRINWRDNKRGNA